MALRHNGRIALGEVRRAGVNHTFHTDDRGSTMALSSGAGAVLERYDYQDFGDPRFFTPGGTPLGGTAVGNTHLFDASRFDAETGFYTGRHVFDPRAGETVQRAPRDTSP